MTPPHIEDFARIADQVVGKMDVINVAAEPYPWFCKDIFRKRDLQWAGYIGHVNDQENALAFGVNLEFTPAWRRVFPKLKHNIETFSMLLCRHKGYDWRWMGRPGVIAKNPPVRFLSPIVPTEQIDITKWVRELEDILDRKVMWSVRAPMRPQIQVMRKVGSIDEINEISAVHHNIKQTVNDLKPLVAFFR